MASLAATLNSVSTRMQAWSDTSTLDAQVLLAFILDRPRAWVLAHPEAELSPEQLVLLNLALTRLAAGEPLPYILGQWEFYCLDFMITPHVLIPRPETELLVERAVGWLRAHPTRRHVADVGTGSGCIAVSLAVHFPDLQVIATDLSLAALKVAQTNAQLHQVADRIQFQQADLLSPLSPTGQPLGAFDLICANLPYIPSPALRELKVYGHEPTLALDGGVDGLDLIRRLLQQAHGHINPGGCMLFEIEASQGTAAYSMVESVFPLSQVQLLTDLAGQDRFLQININ